MPISRKTKVEDIELNLDTGEVNAIADPNDMAAWPLKKKDDHFKCSKFVTELEARQIDLTGNEDDLATVRNALAYFGVNGKDLYIRVCRLRGVTPPHSHYDEKKAAYEFDEAVDKTAFKSAGKFFGICKHFGITMQAIKEKEEKKFDLQDQLPEGVDPDDYFKHGFYEHEGGYHTVTANGPRSVCEFTIRVLYLVKSKDHPKRIVEIKNKYGAKAVLDLPTDAFTSLGNFKKAVESVGNFVFEGNETDLTKLKKKLFREEKATTEITRLGYFRRGNFYAFSNGIFNGKFQPIDEYGIVNHHDFNYFIPFMSEINSDDDQVYIDEKKFRFIPTDITFAQWSKLIMDVYGDNGLIGICFYVAALFRDFIFDINGNFPMLNLFGQRSSGKSQFAQSFKYLFGQPQESISLENPSSVVGVFRSLSRFHNAIIHLDEYKNSLDRKQVGMLKGLYDGFGRTVGKFSNDNQTNVTKPNSSVMVSGQELPNIDNALFTRFILLEFNDKNRNVKAFNKLKEVEKKELSGITTEILKLRPQIESFFKEMAKEYFKYLREKIDSHIEDRMLQNMSAILAPISILMDGGFLVMPVSKEKLVEISIQVIMKQHEKIGKSTDASRFWDIFAAMARTEIIKEGIDFRFMKGDLLVRMGNIHPVYMKEHRSMFGTPGLDKTTIEYYLQNSEAFRGMEKQKFNKPGTCTPDGRWESQTTSCYRFEFKALNIDMSIRDVRVEEEEDEKL